VRLFTEACAGRELVNEPFHGGFLFVLLFFGYELVDFRKAPNVRLSRNRELAIEEVVAIGLCYFGAIALFKPLTDFISQVGPPGGFVGYRVSWLMATDYMALTVYLVGLATAFFGLRAIREIITGFVVSVGMMYYFLIDAFPPIGIGFHNQTNFVVAGVALLSKIFGLPIYGIGNMLTILGKHGTYRLYVFWPSVIGRSMLIFSLVMIVLVAKLSAPVKRKIIYAVVGAAGTVVLDVVRISIISYYLFCCATSSEGLEAYAFHNTIGQLLYPVWIIAYLSIVLKIEKRLRGNATNPLLTGQSLTESVRARG